MGRRGRAAAVALAVLIGSVSAGMQSRSPASAPETALTLRLHPENPHYFLFRGRPTVVITSGEHYGAVLNLDFDYRRYFATLAADRLNGTRIFSGTYVETGGNFGIAANTLDPAPGRFISPWARSATPGYADGGTKFDLTRFDDAYVARLRAVLQAASERGIIVELVLFCPLYEESMWAVSPMNPANNVNGVPSMGRADVLTLDRSGPLLAVQEAVARHLVEAVAGFDNVYLEICNEPYATKVPDNWVRHMTTVVADAVAKLPQPILLSQNIANKGAPVIDPHPAVSIFNFHYATPPDTIAQNNHLGRLVGDNETGFRGTGDTAYRSEGWEFVLAGGGLYNNLDYSFTVGHEDGTFQFPSTQPGGGGVALRRQLSYLRQFIDAFDLTRTKPDPERLSGGPPPGGAGQVLAEGERLYGVYLRREATDGAFSARWTGTLCAPISGSYEFHVTSNDGVRVTVGVQRLVEDWTEHATKTDSAALPLTMGESQSVAVEYFYTGGSGVMRLEWTRPDGVREVVPASAWRSSCHVASQGEREMRARLGVSEPTGGLRAEYFYGIEPKGQAFWFRRMEPRLDQAFGTGGPRPPQATTPVPPGWLNLRLPPGTWSFAWLNPVTGETIARSSHVHRGIIANVSMPPWADDIAVLIQRQEPPATAAPR